MGKVLESKKILIVGDTIIDRNIYLEAIGLSLESPTLKTSLIKEDIKFGGAANVAKYASLLGAEVTFITSLNDKNYQNTFKNRFNVETIFIPQERTNIKTRFWVQRGNSTYKHLQVNSVNEDIPQRFVSSLSSYDHYDTIAISDYRCGLVSENLTNFLKKSKTEKYAASQVSAKVNNFDQYSGFDYFVMNQSEAVKYTGSDEYSHKDFSKLKAERIYVTLGEDGAEV